MARWPRYRFRTWAREHAPGPISRLFPPGTKDCGRHEWFRNDEHTDVCWHCTVGEREHVPARIDPTSELWQELSRAAHAGSSSAQEIVDRMIAEDEEARRVASA
jgi:N-acetyl-anhydromuramyl-L-alanine amidase AmpD